MDTPLEKQFGFCWLTHLGVIRVSGADAAAFLHGQLTQDVIHQLTSEARLAAYCSAKGRMLASFVVLKIEDSEFLLICSKDILSSMIKRIRMFVMRAKVTLDDASNEFAISGHLSKRTEAQAAKIEIPMPSWRVTRNEDLLEIHLPIGSGCVRTMVLNPSATASVLKLGGLSFYDWSAEEVRSGIAMLGLDQSDLYTPQMLNYESIGAVNFKKGCYPGQEIVARSQFRGAIKRRAFIFNCTGPCSPGDEVFATGEDAESIGTVVSTAQLEGRHTLCIACVQAAVSSSPLQINSNPIGLMALPYELATDI